MGHLAEQMGGGGLNRGKLRVAEAGRLYSVDPSLSYDTLGGDRGIYKQHTRVRILYTGSPCNRQLCLVIKRGGVNPSYGTSLLDIPRYDHPNQAPPTPSPQIVGGPCGDHGKRQLIHPRHLSRRDETRSETTITSKNIQAAFSKGQYPLFGRTGQQG